MIVVVATVGLIIASPTMPYPRLAFLLSGKKDESSVAIIMVYWPGCCEFCSLQVLGETVP